MELFSLLQQLLDRLFCGKDPAALLVAPLLYYVESRLDLQRIGRGELRRSMLRAAIHIVRFHKLEEKKELKNLVNELIDTLLETLEIFCFDVRAVKAILLGSRGVSISPTPFGIPIPEPPP